MGVDVDAQTAEVLTDLGIKIDTVPSGTVRLLQRWEIFEIGSAAKAWATSLDNAPALAYEIETETMRHVGLLLRNLYLDKSRRSMHVEAPTVREALWHDFSTALPQIWRSAVAVLVEGPKDAKVLFSYGIPAIAYLTGEPSQEHIKVLVRYAKALVWVPDSDLFERNYVKGKKRERVIALFKKYGFLYRVVKIPVGDPADLAGNFGEIKKLLDLVEQTSILVGGGYTATTR